MVDSFILSHVSTLLTVLLDNNSHRLLGNSMLVDLIADLGKVGGQHRNRERIKSANILPSLPNSKHLLVLVDPSSRKAVEVVGLKR